MILRQQKTLSGNHYGFNLENAETAFFMPVCAMQGTAWGVVYNWLWLDLMAVADICSSH